MVHRHSYGLCSPSRQMVVSIAADSTYFPLFLKHSFKCIDIYSVMLSEPISAVAMSKFPSRLAFLFPRFWASLFSVNFVSMPVVTFFSNLLEVPWVCLPLRFLFCKYFNSVLEIISSARRFIFLVPNLVFRSSFSQMRYSPSSPHLGNFLLSFLIPSVASSPIFFYCHGDRLTNHM